MTDPVRPGSDVHSELDETAIIARELIRIDTTNYGDGKSKGETEAAEYAAAKLEALGLAPQLFDADTRRTSVVARVEGRNHDKPALVVHGHLDVVPADASQWSVDPFAGEIRDGLLWGRGAVDMMDMDAMILTALGDVLSNGGQPERDLIVAFFADEENGGVFGSHFLVRERPELFAGASEAISEVGGYSIDVEGKPAYLLQTGEKAMIWARLVAEAPAGHGSRLVKRNAVTELAEAVAKIGRLEWPVELTDTTRELIAELSSILGVEPKQVGPDEIVLRTGSAAGFITATLRSTANPTMLTAGYKSNVIPGRAEARVDIRPLPGQEDAVLTQLEELVGENVRIEIVTKDTGLENPTSGELVDAVRATIERNDPGVPVLPYLMPAGTDNKALSLLGIRGYGFAPLKLPPDLDFPAMFHGVDERVPLDALVFGRKVLGELLAEY
ncbi:M20/M25/M40 family metallo-hydrolase [Gryllotalpicola reticulitermitis]|uniref:M20/M25/M40 family metallo-hydrolase n=1 Tax=Gryllotalpicola reticulitermitis TaxID=1184153 RepID=A0ABV8QB97_9MICO